jgi:AraC-like DNA-binding protein
MSLRKIIILPYRFYTLVSVSQTMHLLSITESIFLFISGLGILQGILLALLIYFHPKSDRSVNKFLALYIFCICCVMTMPVTIDLVGWKNSYVIQPIPLLPGIFLYFYLLSFKGTITWKKALPHFIVPFVFLLLTFFNLSALAKVYPNSVHIPVEGLRKPSTLGIMVVRTSQQFFYFFLSWKALKSYQHSIQNFFSDTSRIDLQWAKFLLTGYIVLISTFLVVFPLVLQFPSHFQVLLLINMAVATPYIYIAAYKGVLQPTIWQIQPGVNKEIVEEELNEVEQLPNNRPAEESDKLSKSKLPDDKIENIVSKITVLMERDKLYQEPELTLQQLADKIQTPPHQVSQAINDGLKKNFYELVNGYRVKEAKKLLVDPGNKNFTILSVGFEAGFNSKTTFNTVFKKFTGFTPTEFREKQKEAAFVT